MLFSLRSLSFVNDDALRWRWQFALVLGAFVLNLVPDRAGAQDAIELVASDCESDLLWHRDRVLELLAIELSDIDARIGAPGDARLSLTTEDCDASRGRLEIQLERDDRVARRTLVFDREDAYTRARVVAVAVAELILASRRAAEERGAASDGESGQELESEVEAETESEASLASNAELRVDGAAGEDSVSERGEGDGPESMGDVRMRSPDDALGSGDAEPGPTRTHQGAGPFLSASAAGGVVLAPASSNAFGLARLGIRVGAYDSIPWAIDIAARAGHAPSTIEARDISTSLAGLSVSAFVLDSRAPVAVGVGAEAEAGVLWVGGAERWVDPYLVLSLVGALRARVSEQSPLSVSIDARAGYPLLAVEVSAGDRSVGGLSGFLLGIDFGVRVRLE